MSLIYFTQLLYSPKGTLDRLSFLQALIALSLISLALLLLCYTIAANTDPYSFETTLPALSLGILIFITSLHAILVILNITLKRVAYIKCSPFYMIGLFIPYLKILFLGVLLLDHDRLST